MKILALLLAFSTLSLVNSRERNNKPHKVVCYYESWADHDKGGSHFVADDINPNVCTHVMYAFAVLKNNTIQYMDPVVDDAKNGGHDMIHRTVNLRKHNPHLTVMISLGGWAEGSTKYSEMAKTATNRKHLIESIVKFLQLHDLDGLDLDWEYPGFTGIGSGSRDSGNAEDKQNYIHLLAELKEAFKTHDYLLTAAVAPSKHHIDRAYDIASMNKYLDFINLMTYVYQGQLSGHTQHNSPLFAAQSDHDKTANTNFTVDYWIKHGASSGKLILGMALYGKSYKLIGADHDVGAKATASTGDIKYGLLCQTLKQPGWTVHWDEHAQVPYAVKDHEWITFENLRSVQQKLDYVKEKHLGGSMVWAVDKDDAHGNCGQGKFPLMKLQMKVLNQVDVHDI